MANKNYVPDRNCEVCGIRVQGEGAVASIVDGHCTNCGAVLSGYKTPEERGEPDWEPQQGQGEGTGATE